MAMVILRQIVSIASANLLAVHVIVGCCAHHHHAEGAGVGAATSHRHIHDVGNSTQECAHHLVNTAEGSHDPAPVHGDGPCDNSCGEGPCSFLAGSKVLLPDLVPTTATAAASAELLVVQLLAVAQTGGNLSERAVIPHLRSHLSKRVLLI
jgi:hypothetical protein